MKAGTLAAAVLAVLFLAAAPPARSASPGEEAVILRVHQAGGDITAEAPWTFLWALSQKPTGVTLGIGQFKGRSVRMSADRLIRMLRDVPAGTKETALFTRQTDQGPVAFFARRVSRPMPPRSHPALLLVLDLNRSGASPTHLVLPLAGSAAVAETLMAAVGLHPDSDVGPLLDRSIECAKGLGTGPLLKASASDAALTLTLR